MKNTLIIFGFLALLCFAAIGTLLIFDVRTWDQSIDLSLKVGGGLLFLGICSVLAQLLFRLNKNDKGGQ
jgi:hypothetical protein